MNGKSLLTEKIREIVIEVKNEFSDIVITIPASIDW